MAVGVNSNLVSTQSPIAYIPYILVLSESSAMIFPFF